MSDAASDLIDRYIAAWNETDTGRRRDLIAQTWTEDATYVDPLMRDDGAAGIDAMIAGVQARFPGWRFARLGTVDAHGDRIRFTWELGPADLAGPANAEAPIAGTDFAVLSPDGRLAAVTGFIDRMPAAA